MNRNNQFYIFTSNSMSERECTSNLSIPEYISPPILQLVSGVFHSLIFRNIAHMQHTAVETLLIHVSFGCSGTGEFLELDEVNFCEVFSGVLVQGPVLLHSPVQGAQLDQLGHHPDGWDPLHHQVPGL